MKITESQLKQVIGRMVKEAANPEEKLAAELEKIEKEHQSALEALEARKQRSIEVAKKKWSPEEVTKRADRAKATYSPEAMAARKAEKDAYAKRSKEIDDRFNAGIASSKKCAECGKQLSTSSELSRYQYNDGPWYCDVHNSNREKAYSDWRSKGNKQGFY